MATIERATLQDMRFLLDSAKAEGWNPGLSDDIPFYYTDPNGFFIEKINSELIGCISAAAYNDTYGFMGFYIVLPKFRYQGYGIKLWNHALAYLGNRTIGLDGVVSQQDNYKKSGFHFYYNNMRFRGKPKSKFSKKLQEIHNVHFHDLVDFDASICGIDRTTFLQHWVTMHNSYGLAKTEGRKLLGYGVIRKCENGYKIGPLFAENCQIAHEIFLSLAAKYAQSDIFIDVVQTNEEALDLVKEYNLEKVFETARMYKGMPPKQLLPKIFGITTFELG